MKHAFWRRPDGAPHKQPNDKYAPSALLATYGERANVNGAQISWPWQGLKEREIAIRASILIIGPDGKELNEIDTKELVKHSMYEIIRRLGGGKPIPPKQLLDSVNKRATEFYKRAPTHRRLVTSISIRELPSSPVEFEKHQLTACNRESHPYPESLLASESFVSHHLERSEYQCIAVDTYQTTTCQAFDAAISAVNVIRGVWMLLTSFQSGHWSLSSSPRRTWIGKIHLGPIQTLHKPDGSLATDFYWCESDYIEDVELFTPRNGWSQIEAERSRICDLVSVSPYKHDLIRLIARYAVALDQSNLDVAFLMLWSLLEKITDTVGANYDATIQRAIAMHTDKSSSEQLLNQMRNRRNQFVHSARSTEDRDQFCFTLKSYVDDHLMALICNRIKANSTAEYGQFLGLPTNIDKLKRLKDLYSLAFDIHSLRAMREGVDGEGI